jgi:hypothetical protein
MVQFVSQNMIPDLQLTTVDILLRKDKSRLFNIFLLKYIKYLQCYSIDDYPQQLRGK